MVGLRIMFALLGIFAGVCAQAQEPRAPVMEELSGGDLQSIHPAATIRFSGSPVLMVFWRGDCTPCMLEMQGVIAAAAAHPKLQVALVSLEDAPSARVRLKGIMPVNHPMNLHVMVAEGKNADLLRHYGDTAALLPFSRFLHADGTLCGFHTGLLGAERIDRWIRTC